MSDSIKIDGRSPRILVVDDEEIVLSLVKDALEDAGYEIELASGGLEALRKLEREHFDFILTDIRMPECDGLELAKRAREKVPAIGVIFMTGYANLNSAKDAIKEGAYDYIMKPFELNEIRQAVKGAIRKRQKDAEKTLAGQLGRLSDLNQLMYTVGDKKSLLRLSLGFALMQGKTARGAVAYRAGEDNQIGLIFTTDSADNRFEESLQHFEKDLLAVNSETWNGPIVIKTLEEHPLFAACGDRRINSFLIPPWYEPNDCLLNIALKRGANLYGFLILGYGADNEMPSDSDRQLLSITASQIAISFENILLLEETRNAYSRLKDLQDQTIQLEKMAVKGQMSAEIGHELNNFLGVVSGNISLLEHQVSQKNYSELDKYIKAVISNLDNIKKFTQGLMDFTTLASKFESCNIVELVEDVLESLKAHRHFQNVEVSFDRPQSSIFTMADIGQLQQLLYNMLNNAADATLENDSSKGRKVAVLITFDQENENFALSVTDNGVGMTPEQLANAFKSRFTTKKSGHGFGLLVCKRIIENHKGKLTIDSTPGEGTTMTINFPVLSPAENLQAVR
ncbi:MAG: response regulator [bacterium]